MVRVVLVAAMVLVATPTAAAAAPCKRAPGGAPFVARIFSSRVAEDRYRMAVAVCDRRRGDFRVLARTGYRLHPPRREFGRRAIGGVFADAAASGRYVTWAHERVGRRRAVGTIVLVRIGRTVSVVHRRTAYRARRAAGIDVALTRRGELAWLTGGRVRLLAGERARLVGTGAADLLAFDDARTVRWRGMDDLIHYYDFRPLPLHGGCPVRERFRPVVRSSLVVLSEAEYVHGLPTPYEDRTTVLRACLRGTGDRVVVQSESSWGSNDTYEPVGIDDTWAVLSRHASSRYGCAEGAVRVIDARDGQTTAYVWSTSWCRFRWGLPSRGSPIAVTDRGLPAWIVTDPTTGNDVLLTAGPDTQALELDRGPAGSLAALRADGPRIAWLSAGQPRSAEPCCPLPPAAR